MSSGGHGSYYGDVQHVEDEYDSTEEVEGQSEDEEEMDLLGEITSGTQAAQAAQNRHRLGKADKSAEVCCVANDALIGNIVEPLVFSVFRRFGVPEV